MRPSDAAVLSSELGGRPPLQVWGRRAMVSAMHPDAALAGLDILRSGGNAVDAAVAVGAALSVTNHNWSGLAGDSTWLVHLARTGETVCLDGYSTCPAGITADRLAGHFGLSGDPRASAEEPEGLRDVGVMTSMTPGTPSAWASAWRRYGGKPFPALLDRAIELAESGVPLSRYVLGSLEKWQGKLAPFATSRSVFFSGDRVLEEGATLVQRDLAETLRRYAAKPDEEFSSGETARRIAACSAASGAALTLDDLASYRPAWREPCRGRYRARDLVVTPPPTAGVHVLQALGMLDNFDLAALGYHSPASLHLLIEAVRAALLDRRRLGGDPDRETLDLAVLLDPAALARQANVIGAKAAELGAGTASPSESTTHFVVMDEAGNIVSATQSIGSDFGCGEIAEGTGLLMNDRTWWMALEGGPNRVEPGRRVNIGHAPTIVLENGRPAITLGSPGGFGIVQYVVQTLVNVIDHGLDLQSAIDAPRFRILGSGAPVGFEPNFDPATIGALKALGHEIVLYGPWTDRVGGMCGVARDPRTGNLLGGHDQRRNCLSAGY